MKLSIGTKSVLHGAHCFFIHPFYVAWGWYKLYGFPCDPRLWIAFFVHDLGYIGKPNMDGPEGELHPYLGTRIMRVFGKKWYWFTLLHSRFLAKRLGKETSKLCLADKYASVLTPNKLWVRMAIRSGEVNEYLEKARNGKYSSENPPPKDVLELKVRRSNYLMKWIHEQHTNTKLQPYKF